MGVVLRWSVFPILTVALVIAFFLAGPAAGVESIRIGGTVSLSGKYQEPSQMIFDAYRLWEKQINERGGLLGRPVELILYNDQSFTGLTRMLYTALFEESKVDLILSPYGTPLTLAASEITEAYGYVMLACAAAGKQIWDRGYSYIFGVSAPAERYFIGLLDLMARKGMDTVAVVFERSAFHESVAVGVRKWAEKLGVSVVFDKGFTDPEKQIPEIVRALSGVGAEGVIFSGYPPDSYRMIRLMKKAGYRPRALSFTIAPVHPLFQQKVGDFAEGIFSPSQWEANERIPFPGTEKFIDDFGKFSGKTPSYFAGSAYASCQILERAVNHTQTLSHQKIRNFISSLDTVTVIGRFKVDHTGLQVGHNPILIQWQNGKKEIVYPRQMRTAPERFDYPSAR